MVNRSTSRTAAPHPHKYLRRRFMVEKQSGARAGVSVDPPPGSGAQPDVDSTATEFRLAKRICCCATPDVHRAEGTFLPLCGLGLSV